MLDPGTAESDSRRWVVVSGFVVVLVALAVFAAVMINSNGKSGSFKVKFNDAELNFAIDAEDVSAESLIKLMFAGDRAEIATAYLEQEGILYRYGSSALVQKIKDDASSSRFAQELRDLLKLGRGPFSCCHSFVDIKSAAVADRILNLPYDDPVAQRLRGKARSRYGIFRQPGMEIQIGVFKGHPRGIAASCRSAEFFGQRVQVFSNIGPFVTVQVAKSFDCDRSDFEWRDTPGLFLQIGLDDAVKVFGDRSYARTEPATIVISPTGYAPAAPIQLTN